MRRLLRSSQRSLLAAAAARWQLPSSTQASSNGRRRLCSAGAVADADAPPPWPVDGSTIMSTANSYVKHCVKLRERAAWRARQQRTLLAGENLLRELADEAGGELPVLVLFLREGAAPPRGVVAQRSVLVSAEVMRKITGLGEAAGVAAAAEVALPRYVDLTSWGPERQAQQQLRRLLVLEAVQDPGNLGTLIRCAVAFGWDAVWLLPGCCDPFNDKALRASRGAAMRVPLAAGSLQDLLRVVEQCGMLLLAAEPEDAATPGQQRQQQQQQRPRLSIDGGATQLSVCLVLGTEGAGLSAEVLAAARPLAVPMAGGMESLNVGVAGSILMFALSPGLPQLLHRLDELGGELEH